MTVPIAIGAGAAPRVAVQRRRFDHVYFSVVSVLMAAGVGIGFARTYAARVAAGTTTPLIHVHGVIFAAWMLLFVAQAALVAAGRPRLHRRVGVAGVFFAALMLVVGTVTGVIAARHGYGGAVPGGGHPPRVLLFCAPA